MLLSRTLIGLWGSKGGESSGFGGFGCGWMALLKAMALEILTIGNREPTAKTRTWGLLWDKRHFLWGMNALCEG